jgi:hypothetical protein
MNQLRSAACKSNKMYYPFEKNSISRCEKKCLAFRGSLQMVNISQERAGQKCALYKPFFCPDYGEHLNP